LLFLTSNEYKATGYMHVSNQTNVSDNSSLTCAILLMPSDMKVLFLGGGVEGINIASLLLPLLQTTSLSEFSQRTCKRSSLLNVLLVVQVLLIVFYTRLKT